MMEESFKATINWITLRPTTAREIAVTRDRLLDSSALQTMLESIALMMKDHHSISAPASNCHRNSPAQATLSPILTRKGAQIRLKPKEKSPHFTMPRMTKNSSDTTKSGLSMLRRETSLMTIICSNRTSRTKTLMTAFRRKAAVPHNLWVNHSKPLEVRLKSWRMLLILHFFAVYTIHTTRSGNMCLNYQSMARTMSSETNSSAFSTLATSMDRAATCSVISFCSLAQAIWSNRIHQVLRAKARQCSCLTSVYSWNLCSWP